GGLWEAAKRARRRVAASNMRAGSKDIRRPARLAAREQNRRTEWEAPEAERAARVAVPCRAPRVRRQKRQRTTQRSRYDAGSAKADARIRPGEGAFRGKEAPWPNRMEDALQRAQCSRPLSLYRPSRDS